MESPCKPDKLFSQLGFLNAKQYRNWNLWVQGWILHIFLIKWWISGNVLRKNWASWPVGRSEGIHHMDSILFLVMPHWKWQHHGWLGKELKVAEPHSGICKQFTIDGILCGKKGTEGGEEAKVRTSTHTFGNLAKKSWYFYSLSSLFLCIWWKWSRFLYFHEKGNTEVIE